MRVTVALRLDPDGDDPTLDAIATALEEPARPLFIGRKPCLPSRPLFAGFRDGETSLSALLSAPLNIEEARRPGPVRLLWPEGEDAADMTEVKISRDSMLTDERNWVSGLHGGGRPVREGTAPQSSFAATQPQEEGQQ